MRFTTIATLLVPVADIAIAQSSTPGYISVPSTIAGNTTFSFGPHVAVLNLDMINGLVSPLANTTAGTAWVKSLSDWIDFVHAQPKPALQLFTRIYFNPGHPEFGPSTPFNKAVATLINATESTPATQIYPAFHANPAGYANGSTRDVVLQKTRYDATSGNEMLEILVAQKIDTVVISGIRTSGVVLSTTYSLFDAGYKVYVISNNTIETPPDTPGIDAAILAGIIPKLPADVITVEQAKAALASSQDNVTQSMSCA